MDLEISRILAKIRKSPPTGARYSSQIRAECLSSSVLADYIMSTFAEPLENIFRINKREGQENIMSCMLMVNP